MLLHVLVQVDKMMLPVAETGAIVSVLHVAAGSGSKKTFDAVLAAVKKRLRPHQVRLIHCVLNHSHVLEYLA